MSKKLLMISVAALAFGGSAYAQTPAPPETAPSMLPVPAVRTSTPPTTLSPAETTVGSIIGAKIFAPRPETAGVGATTARSPAEPTMTGSTPGAHVVPIPTLSDVDWSAMRENHDNIGDVGNLVLNNDGRVHQVVLGVGGFLGVGEKSVAVDWADVTWMRDSNGKLFGIVHRTKQQLKAAPRFVDRR